VNGCKFHTKDRSKGLKTFNSGVCVTGTGEGDIVDDYCGIRKEVVELVYPNEPTKKCVLFTCDWLDPTINHGMRVHKEFRFVDVHYSQKYGKYDPYIFAETTTQVFFVFLIQGREGIK